MSFDSAFKVVVGLEGAETDDPSDPGGRTKFGLSHRANPDLDFDTLTLEQAKARYLERYWQPAGCTDLPEFASLLAFDCSVNQGADTALMFMQAAVGVRVDGDLGPLTRAAFASVRPSDLARFMALRAVRYAANKNFQRFGHGWFNRLFELAIPGAL